MKIFMLECTEDELRANRGIMDAIVEACSGLLSSLYGNHVPCCEESGEDGSQESEPQETENT